MKPINYLLSRRSCKSLVEPVPNKKQLELILSTAMRAPDHGHLRPWRYVVISKKSKMHWLDFMHSELSKQQFSQKYVRGVIRKMTKAPMIIILGMRKITEHTDVSIDEQIMAASAAAMNILNAVHMLKFGAVWITAPTLTSATLKKLGLYDPYRLMGFLLLGTPSSSIKPVKRGAVGDYVAVWKGTPVQFKIDR